MRRAAIEKDFEVIGDTAEARSFMSEKKQVSLPFTDISV
jgi:hypothetical protein